jgi:DnaJ-class molecular chaperone
LGVIEQNLRTNAGLSFSNSRKCEVCSGIGWRRRYSCKLCKNRFTYSKKKEIKVKIPKNYNVGQTFRLRGQGHESWKAPNGDIFSTVNVSIPNLEELSEEDKNKLKEMLKN